MTEPPHDWRVWWDATIHKWKACRWDNVGGICTADTIEVTQRFATDGRFLRFENTEAKIGGARWIQNGHVDTKVLRLVPRTQFISVETIRVQGRQVTTG